MKYYECKACKPRHSCNLITDAGSPPYWCPQVWFPVIILVVLLALLFFLSGCESQAPVSKLSLNLVDGILTSDKTNTETDIGSIEYTEVTDPNGVSKITIKVESYKVTEAKLAMQREQLREENLARIIAIAESVILAGVTGGGL